MPTNNATLLRACGRGSQQACDIARRINVIFAGSVITFSDVKGGSHPNKLPFTGTLLILDEASQKAPHGSEGHRIFVSTKAAKDNLSDIVGMAINYQPGNLDAHATRHKVGVVTRAWIEGKEVKISGFIWDRDFPEADRELKGRNDLGMSMELADVYVDDEDAQVWNLTKFRFTGATILKKNAAAYSKTSLAAQAAKALKASNVTNDKYKKYNTSLAAKTATREEGDTNTMKKEKEKVKVAAARRDTGQDPALLIQAMGGQLQQALQATIGPMVTEIKASNARNQDLLEELNGRLHLQEVQASAEEDSSDDEIELSAAADSSDDEMEAAKEDDDSDSMAAARAKKGEAEDGDDGDEDDSSDDASYQAMEDLSLEDASEEPGDVNEDATNQGSKTTVTKPPKQKEHFSGNVAKGRLKGAAKMKKPFGGVHAAGVKLEGMYASAVKENRKLRNINAAMVANANRKINKLETQNRTIMAQLERFSELEGRRSAMPTELTNLAAKAGVNLGEIKASGQKVSVQDVDTWFAAARAQNIIIPPEQRIAMKMQLEECGVMDQGVVDRGYGRPN